MVTTRVVRRRVIIQVLSVHMPVVVKATVTPLGVMLTQPLGWYCNWSWTAPE